MKFISIRKILNLTWLLLLLPAGIALAQTAKLSGQVLDKNNPNQPLIGANVVWLGTSTGTATDVTGNFTLPAAPEGNRNKILVTYIGYKPDTIAVHNRTFIKILLTPATHLQEVTIEAEQVRFSAIDPVHSQIITTRDLEKSACCNLAESFETNASVEVSTTDAVSGAKQIQMLGLDGAYTLLTMDNIPSLRGLATPYRLNYLSGTYIESIDIIKGMGSVLNGYESISGQVNVKLKEPDKTERVYFNLYANSLAKADANLNLSTNLSDKWSTVLMLHTDYLDNRVDRNKDGFMDQPLTEHYNVFSKWKYTSGKNIISETGIGALRETKVGGQTNYEKGKPESGLYGTESVTDRLTAFNKTSYTFEGKPYQSLGLIVSGTHHDFESVYGLRRYDGTQNSFLGRLIFQSIIGHTGHTYKTGLSYVVDDYDETLADYSFNRRELIPGAFLEYIYKNDKNLTLVAGARGDHHNLYGFVFTPRLNVKFDATPNTILRVAAGQGFRVANPVSENSGALVSSRQFIFKEELQPEKAWNLGGSFTQYFTFGNRNGAFVADYYYTDFREQVVADMYSNPHAVIFTNLNGRSFSRSFQAEVQYELAKGFNLKTAYKYFDVKSTYQGKLMDRPYNPKNRFFVNLAYATPFDKWRIDATTQWFGRRPLPESEHGAGLITRPSDQYYVVNGQISRAFKRLELYTGVENLLNYRQENPIVSAAEPFGPNFDASMVWGPIVGRVVYGGLRYKLN